VSAGKDAKDVARLRELLRQAQEPQGYFFNADDELVGELLEALYVNRDRYGYMACPCRLASGERDKDRDIMCPCVYRAPDVAEYGTCYCGLYVSAEYKAGKLEKRRVPERRPPDKIR
jgi:ferredoxin-thioredoxin reductase catalytic subunit